MTLLATSLTGLWTSMIHLYLPLIISGLAGEHWHDQHFTEVLENELWFSCSLGNHLANWAIKSKFSNLPFYLPSHWIACVLMSLLSLKNKWVYPLRQGIASSPTIVELEPSYSVVSLNNWTDQKNFKCVKEITVNVAGHLSLTHEICHHNI